MKNKFYCVYLAYSKYEVLPSEVRQDNSVPMYPPDIARVRAYLSKDDQMRCYTNTMCEASQTFEADSEDEIIAKVAEYNANFLNEDWLSINIYPYI